MVETSASGCHGVTMAHNASYHAELVQLQVLGDFDRSEPPSSPINDADRDSPFTVKHTRRDPQLALMVEALREQLPADVCEQIQALIDLVIASSHSCAG